ncbi:ROK family protein [Sphingomonas sp. G124]|uniref:ROK family protein n=1 Tax=Sphingomonas cremea TaxID=2904799 RepID=A0A9X1TYS7_9SPHN|nr:ROK family protein [Sphingomonas cremea]MCF2515438.1 ROK family protein [Sphingomonas cremea]
MTRTYLAGIETGGTKILARVCDLAGRAVADGKWATTSPERAAEDALDFLISSVPDDGRLGAIGIAAFGPLIVDPESPDHGRMLATTKSGWAGSNLCRDLQERLGVPVAVDTDVNAAAIAEQQLGAGAGFPCVAYVTVGTGIGAGLSNRGQSLTGALHPEAGHLRLVRRTADDMPSVCPYHSDCAEGLVSGPAVRRRLGEGRELASDPSLRELVADYLGQLAAALVLAWSPHRIVWGGGVICAAPIIGEIEAAMLTSLGGYGVGPAASQRGFCVQAALEHAGLEGALLIARKLQSGSEGLNA